MPLPKVEIQQSALKPNVIDKVASYFPGWAKSRLDNRLKMAANAGGYEAATKKSAVFDGYLTAITDADGSVDFGDRLKMVERDRQIVRDVPVARGLINRVCDHSVGARGLTLHPQIDARLLGWSPERATAWQDEAESLWRLWSESAESDIMRVQNFQQKTYLTLESMLEGGDCFTIFTNKERPGSDFKLKLQTIESERVSNKDREQDTDKLVEGVVKGEYGEPIRYQISNHFPNDYNKEEDLKWVELDVFDSKTGRRNILQHYNQIRPGQTRGIPILGTVTDKLVQLGRLSNAELLAAVINSFYTVVITGEPGDTKQTKSSPSGSGTESVNDKLTLGSGSIVRADDGTQFESFDPQRPNHRFEPYFNAMVAEIGAAVGVPRSLIMMTFDKSYSASRGEVLLAWVYFMAKRTDMAVGLCQPTYEAFLDEAVSRGMLQAPGYFSNHRIKKAFQGSAYNQWTGPTRPAIDELKEAKANELYNKMGIKSLTGITTEVTGKDWVKVIEQIIRENKLRADAGLEDEIDTTELLQILESEEA
jgi:lambda family phage portal protein